MGKLKEVIMKNYYKKIIALILMFTILLSLVGCAYIDTTLSKLTGNLIGNDYVISQYDNFGSKVFTVTGDRIALHSQLDENGNETSYIDITIDGHEWLHVGGTLVFAQEGVDMITDFSVPENMDTTTDNNLGFIAIDRFVNNYKNLFGKSQVVLVSSQTGTPIGLFQGNNCYTEIPGDLPKTTLINIDGKLVYVHRANVDIIETKMFNN